MFVDESGSFDASVDSSRFYIVCMVFHDQSSGIEEAISWLNASLINSGIDADRAIHAGPLVRMEEPYRKLRREERRLIFAKLLAFTRNIDIAYKCFCIDKRWIDSADKLHDALLQQMMAYLVVRADEFNEYDRVKVYYDNGQAPVSKVLKEAFSIYSSKTEFVPDVKPENYRLFQVADMICALELVRHKLEVNGHLDAVEDKFFYGERGLRKNYLRAIQAKATN